MTQLLRRTGRDHTVTIGTLRREYLDQIFFWNGLDLVEHAADADAVDMRRLNTESDDPTREDVHDNHHPEALQQDGLASEKIDRSTLHRLSLACAIRVSHDGPSPPGFGL